MHFLLYLLILLKLSEDVLDRADIFILELQELRIPKPDFWEWLYGISFLANIFAARAMRTNSVPLIRLYQFLTWTFSLGPICVAQIQYFPDFYHFVQYRDLEKLTYAWRTLPLAVVFEAFALIALQVHFVQAWYSFKLGKIWTSYSISSGKQITSSNNNVQQQQFRQTSPFVNKKIN